MSDRTLRVFDRMELPTDEEWSWEDNPEALMINDEYLLIPRKPCKHGNYAPHLAVVDDEARIHYTNVYNCDGQPEADDE